MKAMAIVRQGEPAELIDLPVPDPGAGQFRVRVLVAGLNPVDGKRASGLYGNLNLPFVPGTDGSGVVDALGEGVTRFAVGDRVFGRLGDAGHGTFAQYTLAAEDGVVARIPRGVRPEAAAALPVAGLTALGLLRTLALSPGDRLLIVGATGGVGSFLVQLAAKAGLEVIATARPGQVARTKELGAALIVDHTSTMPVHQQLTARGIDRIEAVVDLAGARETVDAVAPLVVTGGKAASIAGGVDVDALAARQLTAFNFHRQATAAELEELMARVASGEIRAVIDRELSLADAPQALQESTRNHMHAKTVLKIDEGSASGGA